MTFAMADVKLDWAKANVEGSKLTVPLEGEPDKGWKESFEKTIRLLGSRDWDEVQLQKQEVRVAGVTPGDEDKLHHYLESVIEQANAADQADTEQSSDGADGKREGPDAEMTERFRAFAEPESDGD
jgi:hypothetical protein